MEINSIGLFYYHVIGIHLTLRPHHEPRDHATHLATTPRTSRPHHAPRDNATHLATMPRTSRPSHTPGDPTPRTVRQALC